MGKHDELIARVEAATAMEYGYGPVVELQQTDRDALVSAIRELREALELADCLLSGANMNKRLVERKVRAALGKERKAP